jgi:hypothetical protein
MCLISSTFQSTHGEITELEIGDGNNKKNFSVPFGAARSWGVIAHTSWIVREEEG